MMASHFTAYGNAGKFSQQTERLPYHFEFRIGNYIDGHRNEAPHIGKNRKFSIICCEMTAYHNILDKCAPKCR